MSSRTLLELLASAGGSLIVTAMVLIGGIALERERLAPSSPGVESGLAATTDPYHLTICGPSREPEHCVQVET